VIDTENFTSRNIKIVNAASAAPRRYLRSNRQQQTILIEDGFAMGMDDTWALYGNRTATAGLRISMVEGICEITPRTGHRVWRRRFLVKHMRF